MAFDIPRTTLRKKLEGVATKNGEYQLQIVFSCVRVENGQAMKATDRKAWFESRIKEVELKEKQGLYAHFDETHSLLSNLFKELDLSLHTLPDEIERQVGITPEQLTALDADINEVRLRLVAAGNRSN